MIFTEMLGLISNDQITQYMNEEMIVAIASILDEWNPVGERAASMSDLDGYRVEAEDIFWSMDLDGESAKQAVGSVLTEAFMIELNVNELDQFSTRIHSVVKRYKK